MFKHSFKRNNKGNFKTSINDSVKYKLVDLDLELELNINPVFKIERDLLKMDLPTKNSSIFFFTDRVRNPDDLISNIESKHKIKELYIISKIVKDCTFLDKANFVLTKELENKYEVHAKFYIINEYVILTSANLNKTNATIEQYLIINDKCLSKKLISKLKQMKI